MAYGRVLGPPGRRPSLLEQGSSDVVDMDVAKFFDRVCQARLLSRLAERITDKRG
jgi:hypothetical protein